MKKAKKKVIKKVKKAELKKIKGGLAVSAAATAKKVSPITIGPGDLSCMA